MRRATTAAGVALLGAGLAALRRRHRPPDHAHVLGGALRAGRAAAAPPSGPATEPPANGTAGSPAWGDHRREPRRHRRARRRQHARRDVVHRGRAALDDLPGLHCSTGRVTTILLPPGERFNGAVGGDVDAFLINVTYAGPRPAVSILPRDGGRPGQPPARHHRRLLQLRLARPARESALNLVDVARKDAARPARASACRSPRATSRGCARARATARCPPGRRPRRGRTRARWSSASTARCRCCRRSSPARRASRWSATGASTDGRQVYLVTDRRVTEAELRLGSESVRLTVDPAAVAAGTAADPARARTAGGRRRARSRRRRPPRPTPRRRRGSRWPRTRSSAFRAVTRRGEPVGHGLRPERARPRHQGPAERQPLALPARRRASSSASARSSSSSG